MLMLHYLITPITQDIQPLRIYHFGGDEVSLSDFEEYPRCAEILKKGN